MNIFGIGGTELLLIIVIMLVVAGPKRMARWAYIMGFYAGKLRQVWAEVMGALQKEINAAGMDVELPKTPPTRQGANDWIRESLKPFTEPVKTMQDEIKKDVDEVKDEIKQSTRFTLNTEAVAKGRNAKKPEPAQQPEAAQKPELGAWGAQPSSNGAPKRDDANSFGTWSQTSQKDDE